MRKHNLSSFIVLSQDLFVYSGSFLVSYIFQDYLFQFYEKCYWDFENDYIESVYCIGQYGLFNNIHFFPIHEHKYPIICFCLLNFFYLYLIVFSVQIFHHLRLLFLDILSGANINGIGIFTFLSDSLVLVYRNTTDLGTFILYPSTLLN